MKIVKRVLAGLGVLVVGLLLFAATKPDDFRVERTASIEAPPEAIYPLISDFHNWGRWSPWEKLDPQMAKTHSGAPAGVGAVYEWKGNDQVGEGRMEILEAAPPSAVTIRLDFLSPFEARNTTRFLLEPNGQATTVTWVMEGPQPYLSKLMSVFMDMDEMIGKDFEAGLANLRKATEA